MQESTFSQQLLEREKTFRLKNKQITSQLNKALERVECVVKEGTETVNRPSALPVKENKKLKPDLESLTLQLEKQLQEFEAAAPKKQNTQHDSDPEGPLLGPEATARIFKAKVDVLEEELKALLNERQEKETNLAVAFEKIKKMDDQRVKDQRQITSLSSQNEKLQKNLDEALNKVANLQTDVCSLKKDLDIQTRYAKHSDQDIQSRDLRLNRALEDLEKAKSGQAQQNQLHKEALETANRTSQDLFSQCKRLQKQKNELLAGFKKQCQLIEILKRQKMHVEASKLLQFTEEDFMKALS